MARPMLVAGCVLLALSCGVALTGCASGDAAGLARQACSHVELGLAAERKASTASRPEANHLEAVALDQVRAALPLAAVAAGEDTSWQALDATLSESNRVPLHYLVSALTAQCANPSGDG
jgi:pectin methylesterase-like acyl-CoA thioesterase